MTTPQAIDRNSAVYHPRIPTASPLYRLLSDHFSGFVASYDKKFSRSHGFFLSWSLVLSIVPCQKGNPEDSGPPESVGYA